MNRDLINFIIIEELKEQLLNSNNSSNLHGIYSYCTNNKKMKKSPNTPSEDVQQIQQKYEHKIKQLEKEIKEKDNTIKELSTNISYILGILERNGSVFSEERMDYEEYINVLIKEIENLKSENNRLKNIRRQK